MSAYRTGQAFGGQQAAIGDDVIVKIGTTIFTAKIVEIDTVNDVPKKLRCFGSTPEEDAPALNPVYDTEAINPIADLGNGKWMWPV